MFSDESRFCLQYHNGHILLQYPVWWHREERKFSACIRHRHTGPSPEVVVLGDIRYTSQSLLRIDWTLNYDHYISDAFNSTQHKNMKKTHVKTVEKGKNLWSPEKLRSSFCIVEVPYGGMGVMDRIRRILGELGTRIV